MKQRLLPILIAVGICLTIVLAALGFHFRNIRITQENDSVQSAQTQETESIEDSLISATPEITETPTEIITEAPTEIPSETPSATPESTPTPEPTQEAIVTEIPAIIETPTAAETTNGHIVAIDPGHQSQGNYDKEPLGPGSSEMKTKVSSGTSGRYTGADEYVVTLDVSLLLKAELEARGYQVVMTRETHDVNISNSERAAIANNSGAEIFIRVHCNGVDDSSVKGALTMAPTNSNPYVSNIASDSARLSQLVIDEYCAVTGFKNRGILYADNMSGINWCKIPVTIIELGFMTNAEDDAALVDSSMQQKMAVGIANGLDAYFR